MKNSVHFSQLPTRASILLVIYITTCLSTCAAGQDDSATDNTRTARHPTLQHAPVLGDNWSALRDEIADDQIPREMIIIDKSFPGEGITLSPITERQSIARALPEWTDATNHDVSLRHVTGQSIDNSVPVAERRGYGCQPTKSGMSFQITGRISTVRAMRWSKELPSADLTNVTHYALRYRASGIARSYKPFAVLSLENSDQTDGSEPVSLLDAAEIRNDGQWHSVVGRVDCSGTAHHLHVHFSTLDSSATLEIDNLEFHRGVPLQLPNWVRTPLANAPSDPRFQCLDLTALFNDTCRAAFDRLLNRQQMAIDGGVLPTDCDVTATDIPFRLGSSAANMIRPKEDSSKNREAAEFAGVPTTRHYLEPAGRDDPITIPINRQVSEVFFVLVAELPKSVRPYANPPEPFKCNDIGALAVELQYSDGQLDNAFPFSLIDGGFAMHRMCGTYAVTVDHSRRLKKIVLHNRLFGNSFSIAAVTINTSADRLVPELHEEPKPLRVPKLPTPPVRRALVQRDGDLITLSNSFYEITVNTSMGFSLDTIKSRWSDTSISLSKSSGLEVIDGETLFTGRAFRTQSATINENSATIVLASTYPNLPLQLTVQLTVDDSPQLRAHISASNVGDQASQVTLRFPVLRSLSLGELDDTWLFFPQYRTVNTKESGSYVSPNDLKFPTQFLDIYNPELGFGLGLLTHNRDNTTMDYAVAKNAQGTSAFIQYPGEFHMIEPGHTISLVDTRLLFHSGDWHRVLQAYRDWLATWYRPSNSQDKTWFKRAAVLRCHQTKKLYSWAIPIFDVDSQRYRVDEFMKGDTQYLGLPPNIMHLFGWIDLEQGWQGHPNGDFDLANVTGGFSELRDFVRRLQDDHGVPVSLYTLSDRCHKESEFGKRFGKQVASQRRDGSLAEDAANWFICPESEIWQEHYAEALRKVQARTGVNVLYIDVFPSSRNSKCYSTEHGHSVPTDGNRGALALIKRLRKSLPPEVVLWSEYPLNDVATQFLDGNIHYYCLNWHTYFSKQYDRVAAARRTAPVAQSICRYAFPNVRQFIFPCGEANWSSQTKFPFFNGEALYDTSWSLYASPHLDRIRKSLAIQTEYADCFASENPVPMVPTAKRHVYANAFPAQAGTKTLWTLYNARYQTVRGPVLSVPHRTGATYFDAWNQRTLHPVIRGQSAVLSLTLQPQSLGCIVQLDKNP